MIIDFHTHVFPNKIAHNAVLALSKCGSIPPHTNGTEAQLIDAIKEAEVDLAVNLPVLTRPEQFETITQFAYGINQKYNTGKGILSFAGVHPALPDPEYAIDEIVKHGFLGIKIHPDYQGAFIDDERYVRLLSLAKAAGLITVTHAGFDVGFSDQEIKCTPTRTLRLLDKLGGYNKLVLAHLGGNMLFDDVYDQLSGEDVYFDTGYILHEASCEQFLKILKKHGDDRILFASDSPWRNIKEEVDIIKGYGLGKSEEKILSLNAKKLLGLKEKI